ncbi:HXXXD-type acyl-transferase family protein [Rhynchospora pubera]|uniref:HXXXD-type acyl-transferase family protein n=1 Tax=Rhynchospora pubera TaxID=906938 RepID=A0AAV8HVU9_9POAL|nr:HXXXD-type acyl-transferase family protein [Rhynchospora pubera]
MVGVRVLEVSRVAVQPGPYPPPGETVQLSFFDSIWVSSPHVQRLFLYPNTAYVSFPGIVGSLKSSLTRVLPFFHPFAGKLTYIPSAAKATIDCSLSGICEGVTFIEAESDLNIHCIATNEVHDLESFVQLVPNITVSELPTEVLGVQITSFLSGGVALGIAMHHAVADGKGLWQFIEAWATICRTESVPSGLSPVHDRALIKYPGGDKIAVEFTRKMSHAFPKEHAIHESPSTFVSISARVLVTIARVRGLADDNGPFIAAFLTDCRPRLDHPISNGYTGNCVSHCFSWMTASDVARPGGFVRACAALKEAIRKATEAPLAGCEGWADEFLKLPAGRAVYLAGSPRFNAYDTDFGWGKPDRVELASMKLDGEVVMVRGKEEGTVQVSVALHAQHMDAFAQRILS